MFKNFNKFNTFSNHSFRAIEQFLLRHKFQRTTVTQQSITYHGQKTWNSLRNSIKSPRTLASFNLSLRNLLVSQ